MPFYRFVDPTYGLLGGAFPGTIGGVSYGRINVTSGGTGGGDGSAIVDGAKSEAPNLGTYLVAFGERGNSMHVNRGLAALGKNTDMLDDIVRANVPVPTYVEGTLGSSASTLAVTGDVWTGATGDDTTLAVAGLAALISPTTGRALRDASGNVVTVSSIEQPVSTVRFRSGFVTNPTLRFSSTLPAGTNYRLWYYGRSALANISQSRPSAWVAWVMELLGMAGRNALHGLSGLNEKYRRATIPVAGALPDTPGNGAQILRDGQALEVLEPDQNYTVGNRPDPFLALFRASRPTVLAGNETAKKGAIGYLTTTTTQGTGQTGNPDGFAAYAALARKNVTSNDISGTGLTLTRVPVGASVRLNPGGASASQISLYSYPTHYWLRNVSGTDRTALIKGHTLLLVTRASGDKQLYKVAGIVSGQVITVASVTGSSGVFTTPDEAATVELFHPSYRVDHTGRLVHVAHPILGGDPSTALGGTGPALFAAAHRTRDTVSNPEDIVNGALLWGAFNDETAELSFPGMLLGDGGLQATYSYAPQLGRVLNQNIATPAAGTADYDPTLLTKSADYFSFNVTGTGTSAITIVLAAALARAGHHITVVVHTVNACTINMTWDSAFLFSGNDGMIVDQVAGATYMWEGKSFLVGGTYRFLMKRVDY